MLLNRYPSFIPEVNTVTAPKKQSSQNNNQNNPDVSTSRLHIRNPDGWEKPDFEELDLCMEVTAYVYNWQ